MNYLQLVEKRAKALSKVAEHKSSNSKAEKDEAHAKAFWAWQDVADVLDYIQFVEDAPQHDGVPEKIAKWKQEQDSR